MREIAAKKRRKKELKQIKTAEREKEYKKELWCKLKELNNNFAKMKEHKKLNNKKKKIRLHS